MRLTEVDEGQLRRITRVLAKTGAALALAGAAAGCAAPTHSVPAAAVKPVTPSASASASSVSLPSPPPSTSAPTTAPSTTGSGAAATPTTRAAVPGQVMAAKAAPGDPCSAAAVACVSLSKQEAWFVSGGKVVRGPIPVATGRTGYGTEPGTFRVFRKNRMWYSTIYNNAPMPYSVFFDGGEAFHQGSTSVRSHGCVHVGASNASWIFNFLHIGDEVQVVR
jgi:lipoprotein-anchoring transpeptidase ErfK/SrfK